jgi:hypothetical protein
VHTKEKVERKGKRTPGTFDIKNFMMQQRFVMSLYEFCKAICVPNAGNWKKSHLILMLAFRISGEA